MKIAQHFAAGFFIALFIYVFGAFVALDLSWVSEVEPSMRAYAASVWSFCIFSWLVFKL